MSSLKRIERSLDGFTDNLVNQVHPKTFRFNNFSQTNQSNTEKQMNRTQTVAYNWKPVVGHKKMRLDPKFILSMQRRKIRIISAVREQYLQVQKKQQIGMIGKALKSYKKISSTNPNNKCRQIQRKHDHSVQKIFEEHQKRKNMLVVKKKKNPFMNFSLIYMVDRKRQVQSQVPNSGRPSTAKPNSISRWKGSDMTYLNMILNQLDKHQKKRIRSNTSQTQRVTQTQTRLSNHQNQNGNGNIKSQRCYQKVSSF